MAADLFLRIGDIKGESQDDRHRDQITVLAWSWGVAVMPGANVGAGGGGGKATFNELSVTHPYDKASPLLMKACATGQHMPEATLTARKRGQGQQDFLVIKMSDVLVTSVMPSAAPEQPMVELVSLRFGKVEVSYSSQKPDGSLDVPTQFRYDITGSRPL